MIRFVDFEASSLAKGSFPVEIAWVDLAGRGESHLDTAYGLACRPLLDLLPPGDRPGRTRAEVGIRTPAAGIVAFAVEEGARRPRVRHRALPDAESLWRTWCAVRDDVAARVSGEPQP